jgi:hypothetical protein
VVAEAGGAAQIAAPAHASCPRDSKEAAQHHAHTMSREERTSWANTRSFFFGAEATAQSAYDAMGAAIQEAEDVVEGAFEMIEESIDHEMQGWRRPASRSLLKGVSRHGNASSGRAAVDGNGSVRAGTSRCQNTPSNQ